ncbi:MAG: hypothetical protein ACK48Q_08230, partial [Burkholderiales bacterium]
MDVLTKWGKFQLVKLVHYSTGIDKEAELDDVNARCLGIFSLYYVGFRGAVIGKSSAIGCLK